MPATTTITASSSHQTLGLARAVALYIGALAGPGLLFVPSLAERTAGPAAVIAWGALLVLSVPLAVTFGALGRRYPVADGLSAYARAAFGETAARVVGLWFVTAVLIGAPAVALIGGYYVSDITRGTVGAVPAATAIFALVLLANLGGLRLSSGVQLLLSLAVVGLITTAVAVTVPARLGQHWTPFAPHGVLAVGSAAAALVWLFVGWEAMAQMVVELRDPHRNLPRAVGLTLGLVTLLYAGLATATVVVIGHDRSTAPLADLVATAFGHTGRVLAGVIAVTVTAGTMNVYIGSGAKLAGALARQGTLPVLLARGGERTIPRAPLVLQAVVGGGFMIALASGVVGPDPLVRATSACFVAVYLLSLASALRILRGGVRVAAATALVMMLAVAVFSGAYLLTPALVTVLSLRLRRRAADWPALTVDGG